MVTPKIVLITGASGGLGAAATHCIVQAGWVVIAADLRPPPPAERVVPLAMDVTDTSSVEAAVEQIGPLLSNGLDCLVTFAGILAIGPLAEMPDERLQRVIDVNVMGTHRAVRSCFPLLRKASGRIILISSETGWQHAMPFNGPYALTKHAVEAYGDALRRELAHLAIRVCIVQPGPFQTGMTGSIGAQIDASAPPDSPFAVIIRKVGKLASDEHKRARNPQQLAEAVVEAALPNVLACATPCTRIGCAPWPTECQSR